MLSVKVCVYSVQSESDGWYLAVSSNFVGIVYLSSVFVGYGNC